MGERKSPSKRRRGVSLILFFFFLTPIACRAIPARRTTAPKASSAGSSSAEIKTLEGRVRQLEKQLAAERQAHLQTERDLLASRKKIEELSQDLLTRPLKSELDALKKRLEQEKRARLLAEQSLKAFQREQMARSARIRARASAAPPKTPLKNAGPEKNTAAAPIVRQLCILANSYYEQKDYEHAARLYRILASAAENPVEVYYRLGRCLSALDDAYGAIAAYRKAATIGEGVKPPPRNYARACNNLGVLLRKAGHYKEALKFLEKAVDAEPNYATPYFNLGLLFKDNLKETDKAVACFEKYLQLHGALSGQAQSYLRDLRKAESE